MKQSPFQLRYVVYPSASFAANAEVADDREDATIAPTISADVKYSRDGVHSAGLRIAFDNEDGSAPFKISLEAIASFTFDLSVAKDTYKAGPVPVFVAVNVARVLYSGARELLATMSARSPYGSVMIESQVIEPKDVHIGFDGDPHELVPFLFDMEFPGTAKPVGETPTVGKDATAPATKRPKAKKRAKLA